MHIYNPSILEAEAGGCEVQSQSNNEFKVSLRYMRFCPPKKEKEKEKSKKKEES